MSDKLRLTITYDEGRTREEARENVVDALRLMLTPDDGDGVEAGRSEPLELTLTE